MKRYYYLGTLLLVFGIPTIIAGFYLSDFISLTALVPFIISITIVGGIWDIWATKHGKKDRMWIWQFNDKEVMGFYFLGLPIEEYLFYVVSSVYVIFMWESIKLIMLKEIEVFFVVILLSCWTLCCIIVPYLFAPKGTKLIN